MSFHQSSFPEAPRACSISLWVNHGHPIMAEIVKSIWDEDVAAYPHDRIISQIVVTHAEAFYRGFEHATYSEVEPAFISPEDYARWALAFAIKHEINTIFPGRHAEALIAIEGEFRLAGITLLQTAAPKEAAVMSDRPALYQRLRDCFHADIVPDFVTWADDYKAGLGEVVEIARAKLDVPDCSDKALCIMPSTGKINKGFFKFVNCRDPQQQLVKPEERVMTIAEFGLVAHSLALRNQSTRKWVIMEYMSGVVYSVDCLAWNGQAVAHVIREKQETQGQGHVVAENEFVQRQVEIIAKDFGLSGVFNAKFLVDRHGRLKLLSATPTFVGGLGMSILAGVNLPWLWLKMHASQGAWAHRIPQPTIGMRLDSVLCSVRMSSAAKSAMDNHG